jgi:7-cyano-7-deazaguanine synthase
MKPNAVVLLSGGLDSATCLAIAKAEGFQPVALAVWYGQRHRIELDSAREIARALSVQDFRLIAVDLRAVGGSALTAEIPVPKDRPEVARAEGVPVTYVPARNTIFLSLALSLAEVVGAMDLFIGVNAVDYSGYPDCRPEFIRAFETLANLGTRVGAAGGRFKVHAPLAGLSKAEIIRRGSALDVPYRLTHSCYDPDLEGGACGRCDSCIIRRRGFEQAGVADPTRYRRRESP